MLDPDARPNGRLSPHETMRGHLPRQLKKPTRFMLTLFDVLTLGNERPYLVKGLIPRVGLTVVWGPPKCGKSFWAFDLAMHVALGWRYRDRRVIKGAVVYCAFEGADGFKARAEAFRQRHLTEDHGQVEFYLISARANLATDHAEMVAAIRDQIEEPPVMVVLDTLNRSMDGSENEPKDMSAYVRAADAIRDAFGCAVVIIHHCGTEGTRPRGHTSLTGAADAQLECKRDTTGNITVTVEWMKDGPEGDTIVSRLESVTVGEDEDGDPISSCVVVTTEPTTPTGPQPKLSKNQQTAYTILREAGPAGLPLDDWNRQLRAAGIGVTRRADLFDIRSTLKAKKLVREYADKWTARHD
jgi:hypothetical protein